MKLLLSNNVQLKKGVWTLEEDETLVAYIRSNGIKNWTNMPKDAGLARSAKSCRLRWMNYLRPDLKRGGCTGDEIEIIIELQESIGNKWSDIAAKLPGRTDNEIKNFWHTYTRKKGIKRKDKQTKLDTPLSDGVKKTESGSSSGSTEPITNSPITPPRSSEFPHDVYIPEFIDWPIIEEEIVGCTIFQDQSTKANNNNDGYTIFC